jgi:hypothetical protein
MAQFTIRIPDALRDEIKQAAGEDRRSMSGEIEWLLTAALSRRRKPAKHKIPADSAAGRVIGALGRQRGDGLD